MIYTVTWTKAALDELADIYNRAMDKAAVTAASHRFDQELRRNAHQKGRGQATFRIFEVSPLQAVFNVAPADRMVRIFWVRTI